MALHESELDVKWCRYHVPGTIGRWWKVLAWYARWWVWISERMKRWAVGQYCWSASNLDTNVSDWLIRKRKQSQLIDSPVWRCSVLFGPSTSRKKHQTRDKLLTIAILVWSLSKDAIRSMDHPVHQMSCIPLVLEVRVVISHDGSQTVGVEAEKCREVWWWKHCPTNIKDPPLKNHARVVSKSSL